MTTSNSRQSHEDCYEVMDKALEAKDGVRVGFASEGEALHYRGRMNHARTLDRNFNGSRYKGSDPRSNTSDYDVLTFRVRHADGIYWVYAEKKKLPRVIEEIKTGEGADNIKVGRVREAITYRRF